MELNDQVVEQHVLKQDELYLTNQKMYLPMSIEKKIDLKKQN